LKSKPHPLNFEIEHGACSATLANLYYLSREYLKQINQQNNIDIQPFAVLTQAMGY